MKTGMDEHMTAGLSWYLLRRLGLRTSRSPMPFFSLRRFSESCRSILVDSNDQHLRRCGSDNNEVKGKPGIKGNICYHLSSLLKILTKETNDQGSANDPLRMSSPSAVKNLRKIWKNYNQFRFFPILRIFFFSCNTNSDAEMLKSHLKAGL